LGQEKAVAEEAARKLLEAKVVSPSS